MVREYARQRMCATTIDSHPRLPRQTGMSDYRGEESQYSMTVHQTGIQDYAGGEGLRPRPHSEEMHDRLDGIRNDIGEGGRLR